VLAGVLTMMVALGALIAALQIPVGAALRWLVPLSDAIIIGLGVMLILNLNPFKALPQIKVPALRHPVANAFVYGLLYGPIALSLSAGEALSRLSVFLWFGLGFGLPLLALSLLAGGLQRQIVRLLAQHARVVNLIGGLLLVGIGGYDVVANWELIGTVFAGG
jgi:cytochrome c-type biogenesis protein